MERSKDDGIITIDLYGIKFRFKPDNNVENPEQIIDELNKYIVNAEKHIKYTASDRNRLAILLLACMNLSKDFRELKIKYDRFESEVMDRTASLLNKIEHEICD
ncbi:MAG: cell division protein ZapA [Desulfamplus sp.]|nr:cell division protein ZapA [Desulfamplus sp.]MBF0243380.1 cell division protein ZapA [Desulfamplus sp.]MBF0390902.1 cell division protein ZapA [Desulfamplus sp.]